MRKSPSAAIANTKEGGDVGEVADYFPIEPVEGVRFSDSYTRIQSDIYAYIAERADQDISFDELAAIVAQVDRNDVRNLAYGAAMALRNLELINFNTATLVARKAS